MNIKIKVIISIIIGVLPVYLFNIYINITGNLNYKVDVVLYQYLGMVFVAMLFLFTLNKYLLKKTLKEYNTSKSTLLYDIGIAFLILIGYYFLLSLGQITYWRWIGQITEQSHLLAMIEIIFSNWFHTAMLAGPFVIITQGFWVISLIFLLQNLWGFKDDKTWHWIVNFVVSLFTAFVNLHNGVPGVIFWFTVVLTTSIFYYNYRRVISILLAFILFQWFDLISLWYYFSSQ